MGKVGWGMGWPEAARMEESGRLGHAGPAAHPAAYCVPPALTPATWLLEMCWGREWLRRDLDVSVQVLGGKRLAADRLLSWERSRLKDGYLPGNSDVKSGIGEPTASIQGTEVAKVLQGDKMVPRPPLLTPSPVLLPRTRPRVEPWSEGPSLGSRAGRAG